ncbi:MAG: hypothetical protein SFY81_04035 [Verrucomicrobiota bacterium]|nr:hypothetical protein [Verrucomicrobiota bacterium]
MVAVFLIGINFQHLLLAQNATSPSGTNQITLLQGSVEVQRSGQPQWNAATQGQTLGAGDRVRTGEKSRAQVYLASGMTITVEEYGEIGVPIAQNIAAKRGILRVLSREKQPGTVFELPTATAALRGTDLLIRIVTDETAEIVVYDGEVNLANEAGEKLINSGEVGTSIQGKPPAVSKMELNDPRYAQWSFYYPAVLNLNELKLNDSIRPSTAAYLEGDLSKAYELYPLNRSGIDQDEMVYRAGLLLFSGRINEAREMLARVPENSAARRALQLMLKVTEPDAPLENVEPQTSSEMVALSYLYQSRADLPNALLMAKRATNDASFAFALARYAELQFSFGQTGSALEAVNRGLALAPKNAHALTLKGFLLSALHRHTEAFQMFEQAIELNAAFGNAWLGRGLLQFRKGRKAEGQRDLLVAASLEPRRSILRSYLAKGLQQDGELRRALHELEIAKSMDPNDPTPWLYAALIQHLTSQVNEAIRSLEKSQTLNTNRAVFRSALLLDQDSAVRSANLARIYQDAGMSEVSVREASQAVQSDYGNFSAHLFLANSFNALRDPTFGDVRYETATVSEYLISNLLAPPGAARLSPQISQQEFSRLFEKNRLGFSYAGSYLSEGEWAHSGVQYGNIDRFSYAIEGSVRNLAGDAPNSDLEEETASIQFKQGFTPADDIYFQVTYTRVEAGDVGQKYDPFLQTNPNFRAESEQKPNLFAGYHHQWSPGSHTLILLANVRDETTLNGIVPAIRTFGRQPNTIQQFPTWPFNLESDSEFDAMVAEAQQIWTTDQHTLVAGGGWQNADLENRQSLLFTGSILFQDKYSGVTTNQLLDADLERWKAYAYDYWRLIDPITVTAGIGYDRLELPTASESLPMSEQNAIKEQVSPKIGLAWTIHPSTVLNAGYSHALGGLFFENSVRLEPTQVGGYNHAYRSISPETVSGRLPGATMRMLDFGSDTRLESGTYFGWQAQWLRSDGSREIGIFEGNQTPAIASSVRQHNEFEEKAINLYLNQLVGPYVALGLHYRASRGNLDSEIPELAPFFPTVQRLEATFHRYGASVHFNHTSGIFFSSDATGYRQSGEQDLTIQDEEFWQFNAYVGYRFPRRQAEVVIGFINLTDEDYRLHPLSTYQTLPRGRAVRASFRLNL